MTRVKLYQCSAHCYCRRVAAAALPSNANPEVAAEEKQEKTTEGRGLVMY